jgi:formate dehydrogenase subunit gamma
MAPDRIPRFGRTERVLHWVHAAAFLVMLATGLVSYVPALSTLVSRRELVRDVHLLTGVAWIAAIVAIVVLGDRRRLASDWREVERLDADDLRWLARRDRPQGRFNAGQKVNAVFSAGSAVLFAITGGVIWLGQRDHDFLLPGAGVIHVGLTAVSLVVLLGHLYLAVIHPRTRHALRGMTAGDVDRAWAEHHHAKWAAAASEAQAPPD